MKIVRNTQARKFSNSKTCIATEYPLNDNDINAAVIALSGRYPDVGRVVNTACKELVYIIKGAGLLVLENAKYNLEKGDIVIIEKDERYHWEGTMTILTVCNPAWYPEQHKEIE
ncbi:MAG: AraC family ligand binding domain-containing protein [Candidatus Roizmanbacteria bacterium]